MNTVSPAIFVTRPLSAGPPPVQLAAVLNQDGSVNDPTHPAKRGEIISIFGTGQGPVANPPGRWRRTEERRGPGRRQPARRHRQRLYGPDPAASRGSSRTRRVSGLSPQYPGMWQINVQIPLSTAPGQTPIALQLNSVGSNDPAVVGYRMVFYVAQ